MVFVFLFILFIPVVLLYSIGYRLDKNFGLTQTGGIYVFYPESGARIFLDGELSDQTSLFERGVFIDEIEPATHRVEVQKPGYISWQKDIEVRESRVAEAYPFLIPSVIGTSSVPRFITLNSGTSVTNTLYGNVAKLFATSTATSTPVLLQKMSGSTSTPIVATSTGIVRKDIQITIEGDYVIASWKGSKDSIPFYFCDAGRSVCKDDIIVAEGDITHVDFYPGRNDVILYSTDEGVFATELDQRIPVNTHKLLLGKIDFKAMDQRIFVKEKNAYYELLFAASSTLVNAISI